MPSKAEATNGGVGVCGALGIAFVVLKLCGVLDWSWWWVLAPFWIPPAAGIAVFVAVLTGIAASAFARQWLPGRTGTGVRCSPGSAYEPVYGWTKRQLEDYLARNPGYRPTYEAELRKRGLAAAPEVNGAPLDRPGLRVMNHDEAAGSTR
jgi:hypothetical protein